MKTNKSNTLNITVNTSLKDVVNYINRGSFTNVEVVNQLNKMFEKTGTTVTTSDDFIFIRDGGNKPNKYYNWLINREAKGVLFRLNRGSLDIICVPPVHLVPTKDYVKIASALEEGVVFEVTDSSIIHLYYVDNWLLSSGNCFNLSLDNDSFLIDKEVINDCLVDLVDQLDKNRTYTFMIRHPKLQILATKPERILMYIREGGKLVKETLEGVVNYKPVEASLTDFKNVINCPLDQRFKFEFGLIIRSPKYNFIVETNRFTFIKKTFYRNLHDVNIEERLLETYRGSENKSVIKELLPQYKHIFELADVVIDKVTEDIVNYLSNGAFTKYPDIAKEVKLALDAYGKGPIDIEIIKDIIISSKYGYTLYNDTN